MTEGYRHFVTFTPKDGVDPHELVALLKTLEEPPFEGLIEAHTGISNNMNKGIKIYQNWLVDSKEVLMANKNTPLHKVVGEKLTLIADWVVVDYLEGSNETPA